MIDERSRTFGRLDALLMELEIFVADANWDRCLMRADQKILQIESLLDFNTVIWYFGAGYTRLKIDPFAGEVVWVELPKYREHTLGGAAVELTICGIKAVLSRWKNHCENEEKK